MLIRASIYSRLVLSGLLLLISVSQVQGEESFDEAKITVAYLYNFAKYVEWPAASEDPNDDFVFCYERASIVSDLVHRLTERLVRGRPISVQERTPKDSLASCHLLYFESSKFELTDGGIVFVGRDRETADISLFESDGKLQFKIDRRRAEKVGLKFRSQLLKLAKNVK